MNELKRLLPLLIAVSCLTVPGFAQAPVINAGGVVNAADYTQSFSPGIMVSIFGTNLAPATELAQAVPLPTVLAGVSVEVVTGDRTVEAPLFFVSAGQINAQLPYGVGGSQVQLRVKNGGGTSNAETIDVGAASPRLYTQTMDGQGEAILVHADYTVVTRENPARAGEWVVLYLTGLGEVNPAVQAGQPGGDGAALGPLNRVAGDIELTVNGQPAEVYFAGLAPTFVGLYQVNFQVPAGAMAGMADITVTLGGGSSQESITFGCALAYELLNSASVGTAGGTVSGGGFSAQIPAGALTSDTQVAVHRVTGGTALSSDAENPVFGLEGIPANYSEELTVTMEIPGEAPVAGEGGLVLVEEGGAGGGTVIDTAVNGSTVTATVQLGNGEAGTTSFPGAARSASVANTAVQTWQYVRKLGREMSPSGHFEVWYDKKRLGAELGAEAAGALDAVEQELLAEGYRWKEPARFPVSVTLGRHQNGGWGTAKRNSRDGTLTMQLLALFTVADAALRKRGWGSGLVQLFHLQYDLQSRFDDLGGVTRWTWWHRVALERHWGADGMSYSDFLFRNPLQLPATDGGTSMRNVFYHSKGAVKFVNYLSSAGAGGIPAVLESWTPANSPVEALSSAGTDVSGKWLEYCRKYSNGEFEARLSGATTTAETMTKRSLANSYRLGDENSLPKTVVWANSRDLMAEAVRIVVAHGYPAGSSLLMSLPSSGADIVARVFEDEDPNGSRTPRYMGEFAGGETIEIPDFDQYQASALVVMLINKRAVKPYDGVTPVQLQLSLKEPNTEVLGWLKECKKVLVQLFGIRGTCQASSGPPYSCGFGSFTPRSWLHNTDSLLNVTWDGRRFSWEGTIDTPWTTPVQVELSGSGIMSEDGMTFEGGTFRETSHDQFGNKVVKEMEITGPLPWTGFKEPRAGDRSYNYKVDDMSSVPSHVVRFTYLPYNANADVPSAEMTKLEYQELTNLYVEFRKE